MHRDFVPVHIYSFVLTVGMIRVEKHQGNQEEIELMTGQAGEKNGRNFGD